MSKYIEFKLIEHKPKTNVWEVNSKNHNICLGIIKWFGRWRQYAFFPESETVFNKDCLEDIRNFLINEMNKRRQRK